MRKLQTTPDKLVVNGQVAHYGLFSEPFQELNIDQAEIYHLHHPAGRWLQHKRLKEWQHIAVITKEYFMAFALVDAKYMGSSFCYVLNRSNGQLIEHHTQGLPGSARMARQLFHEDSRFKKNGYAVTVENRLCDKRHHISIDIAGKTDKPGIRAQLTIEEDFTSTQPLVTVLPIAANRPLYTHKMVCRARGSITLGAHTITLDPQTDLALLDVQKTYYPHNTFWKWATCAGYDGEGRQLAINMVSNMISEDDLHNENVLWVDGQLTPLAATRFDIDERDYLKPWHLHTSDGQCELTFTPQGERAEKINLGLIVSDYHQPYGLFSGFAHDQQGRRFEFDQVFGVTEYHRARF